MSRSSEAHERRHIEGAFCGPRRAIDRSVLVLVICSGLSLSIPSEAQSIDRARLPAELAHLSDEEVGRIARLSPLPAAPVDRTNRFVADEEAAELGHHLFFETRLSPKGVSCATCHDPARAFTDGRPLAVGVGVARRNAPTVVDAARRRWNGWDGKFDSLWSQALAPIEHPDEMGGDRTLLIRVVRDDARLRARYERVFGAFPSELERGESDPIAQPLGAGSPIAETVDQTTAHLLKALGAYQSRLQSGPTPLDRFVASLRKGASTEDLEVLSPSARRGLARFVTSAGCYQCHRGPSFTDEEFHALGLAGANGRVPDDPARLAGIDFVKANPFNASGVFSDDRNSPKAQLVRSLRRSSELFGQFRTPPLRGVSLTPPYMHDGRFATLEDVVRFYDTLEGSFPVGHHGESMLEPLGLGDAGQADLVAFLRSLEFEIPGETASAGDAKATNLRWWRQPEAPSARSASPTGR